MVLEKYHQIKEGIDTPLSCALGCRRALAAVTGFAIKTVISRGPSTSSTDASRDVWLYSTSRSVAILLASYSRKFSAYYWRRVRG